MAAVNFVADASADAADRALRDSLAALDHARQRAVLWFGDILRRRLYRDLGYSSIYQYAREVLQFSRTRTADFVRLAGKLDRLPAVRESIARGEIGYTKAREIAKVASPDTERAWLEVARKPRREVERAVKRARVAAKANPDQAPLFPAPAGPPAEVTVRLRFEFTPEQEARREALMERLRKLGGASGDQAEMLLEALAALVIERETAVAATRQGPPGGPPRVVHVHHCPECGKTQVTTLQGDRRLGPAESEHVTCDALVVRPNGRAAATVKPAVRRAVLARDRHRCRAPGCGRTRFLEVHHIVPRARGGRHDMENLITMCAGCHRLWHERDRGAGPPGVGRE